MLCRHLPPGLRQGIMQQAAELAGHDVDEIFHDAEEEALTAEIEVQQERNRVQELVTKVLQLGSAVVAGILIAAARGGGASIEQRNYRRGMSSNCLFSFS